MCVEMHWILNFIKTYNMKILQVAFLLLFNYLDSLPKLYSKQCIWLIDIQQDAYTFLSFVEYILQYRVVVIISAVHNSGNEKK